MAMAKITLGKVIPKKEIVKDIKRIFRKENAIIKHLKKSEYEKYEQFITQEDDFMKLEQELKDYLMLKDVPMENRTTEVVNYFLSYKSGMNLEYIEKEERTFDLCEKAVKKSGKAYKFVPKQFKGSYLAFEAAKSDPNVVFEDYFSKEYYSEALFECVVKRNPMLLKDINEIYMTEILIMIAANSLHKECERINKTDLFKIKKNSHLIRSEEYSLVTLLSYVPEPFQTDTVCKYFLDRDIRCLSAIKRQSTELCLYSLAKDPLAYKYIKNKKLKVTIKKTFMFLRSKLCGLEHKTIN